MSNRKPKLSFGQIWNMSFGFLGIQFGFALQGGFMSRIFQTLGADPHDIPGLWLAAPVAGLLVQPIIGYMSDRTWSEKYGRRKPFFLIGAVLASVALVFMPHSPVLWIAAGSLLMLDASINISMEPFRALVADKLDESQRSYGFMVQTLIIGVGTWVASQLPWFLTKIGVSNEAADNVIPDNVKLAFAIGGVIFLGSILYTIFTTKEYPPEDLEEFEKEKKESAGFVNGVREIFSNIINMPLTMKKLGVVQFFSWFAFFTMWSMATPALTEHVFNAPKPDMEIVNQDNAAELTAYQLADANYNKAADLVGSAMGTYGLSSMIFALLFVLVTSKMTINRKYVHMGSLAAGGLGFIMMFYSDSQSMLHLCFALIGISWGSILSLPYAMLSSSIEANKIGVFMGLFNMFIVIPQIVASLGGINFLTDKIFGDGTINTMLLAGCSLLVAAVSNLLITNRKAIKYEEATS
ncbi:MFS transporter [Bacteroidia bacterium]|nr:MFS transporter [Bacteroidia bacterium]MDB9883139.1 MFS transporter [Bacteroidia bacterium]